MRTSFLLIIIAIVIVAFGGFFFVLKFASALAPAKVTITEKYISTNRDFINGVTIEKLKVDSFETDNVPAKYTVTYLTSCNIIHPEGRPPEPPDIIFFDKEGKYWWSQDGIKFKTCPLKFEREQWYFFTLRDPQITGIFFYIDKTGKTRQITKESGVSPI